MTCAKRLVGFHSLSHCCLQMAGIEFASPPPPPEIPPPRSPKTSERSLARLRTQSLGVIEAELSPGSPQSPTTSTPGSKRFRRPSLHPPPPPPLLPEAIPVVSSDGALSQVLVAEPAAAGHSVSAPISNEQSSSTQCVSPSHAIESAADVPVPVVPPAMSTPGDARSEASAPEIISIPGSAPVLRLSGSISQPLSGIALPVEGVSQLTRVDEVDESVGNTPGGSGRNTPVVQVGFEIERKHVCHPADSETHPACASDAVASGVGQEAPAHVLVEKHSCEINEVITVAAGDAVVDETACVVPTGNNVLATAPPSVQVPTTFSFQESVWNAASSLPVQVSTAVTDKATDAVMTSLLQLMSH
jgi:hypothetical protein